MSAKKQTLEETFNRTLDNEALALIHAGSYDSALACLASVETRADDLPAILGRVYALRAEILSARGELRASVREWRKAIETLPPEKRASRARAIAGLAKTKLTLETPEKAREELAGARAEAEQIDDSYKRVKNLVEITILEGLIALSAGDLDLASAAAAEATALMDDLAAIEATPEGRARARNGAPASSKAVTEGMYIQMLGLLATRGADPARDGRQLLEEAVRHFADHSLPYHEARALEALGRAVAEEAIEFAVDNLRRARELYAQVGASFLEKRASSWLEEAERTSQTAGSTPTPRTSTPRFGLTESTFHGIFITGRDTAKTATLTFKYAPGTAPVLITGETGTGKEKHARAVHLSSDRAAEEFLVINCGVIQKELMRSELFGHEAGSFTGAKGQTKGMVRQAEGGTLFLDEIGELDFDCQVALLRLIQQGEIHPLGAPKPVKVNVRIVCATNVDLERAVEEGTFRQDLYYRLNARRIRLTPLRERPNEIPRLAARLLANYAKKRGVANAFITREAQELLKTHSWPGNVRELEGFIEQLFEAVSQETGKHIITPEYVAEALEEALATLGSAPGKRHNASRESMAEALRRVHWFVNDEAEDTFRTPFDEAGFATTLLTWTDAKRRNERLLIANALLECGGKAEPAAKRLDVALSTFMEAARKAGLVRLKDILTPGE